MYAIDILQIYYNFFFSFMNHEAEMMHRLIARSGADPEVRARAEHLQHQHSQQLRPTKFSLGYPGRYLSIYSKGPNTRACAPIYFAEI